MDVFVYMACIGLAAGLVKGVSGFGSSLVTIPLLTMVFGVDRLEEIVVMMITFNVVLNILLMKENKAFKMEHLQNIKLIVIPGAIFTVIGLLGLKNLNGDYFKHGTGHGLGLDVHENPRVSSINNEPLELGACVTIEPGIYISGLGGVRIEDDVILTEDGCIILNKFPKELIIIK